MCKLSSRAAVWLAFLGVAWASHAAAAPCAEVSRHTLARCVRQASLERRAGEAAVRAAEGRVQASDPWLPSSPTLALSGSRRRAPDQSALNWSASLGVELEIAGQRGARREAALAEREAERNLTAAGGRALTAQAFELYFAVLAAREERELLAKLDAASARVVEAAKAAAERGAAAGIDADVADTAHIAILQRKIDAARDERLATASLSALVGLLPTEPLTVSGSLQPLEQAARVRLSSAPSDAPDVLALTAERRAFSARASALRRSRVPNPTVSLFLQREGFNEDVVGIGLAIPLPLPEPLGRTFAGQIAENEALAERATLLAENRRRGKRAELARAVAAYDSALEMLAAFDPERVGRAQRASEDLAAEVQAGRLSIRDAVVLQGPLLELRLAAIQARRTLCQTSVELLRAAGAAFEGEER